MTKKNSNGGFDEHWNPEIRAKVLADAICELGMDQASKLTAAQECNHRAMQVLENIQNTVRPVLKTAMETNQYNEFAMRSLVSKLFLEGFRTWSKDELLFLTTVMFTEQAMVNINEQVKKG